MFLHRTVQKQGPLFLTLGEGSVVLECLNTLGKRNAGPGRLQLSGQGVTAFEAFAVEGLGFGEGIVQGAPGLFGGLLFGLRLSLALAQGVALGETGSRLLNPFAGLGQLPGALLGIRAFLGREGFALATGAGQRLRSPVIREGGLFLLHLASAGGLVGAVFTGLGCVQIGLLDEALALAGTGGVGMLRGTAHRAGFALGQLAGEQGGRLGQSLRLQAPEGVGRLDSGSGGFLPAFLSLLPGAESSFRFLLGLGDGPPRGVNILLGLLGFAVHLLGVLGPAEGKSVLFLGLLVGLQVLLNFPRPGTQGFELLGGAFDLLGQLLAPGLGLSDSALLLGQLIVTLVQGAQRGEGRVKMPAAGLRGLFDRTRGEELLLGVGHGVFRGILPRTQGTAQALAGGLQGAGVLGLPGALFLDVLFLNAQLGVTHGERGGGAGIRKLLHACFVRFPFLNEAFTARDELFVLAPVLAKLKALVEGLGVTVSFAGKAGLFPAVPRGGGARLLDTGGEPRVKGFGGDGFGGNRLRGFFDLRRAGGGCFGCLPLGGERGEAFAKSLHTTPGTIEIAVEGLFIVGNVLPGLLCLLEKLSVHGLDVIYGEHLLEQFFTLYRLGLEELRELPLREEHDLEELFAVEVNTLRDDGVDLFDLGGDGLPGLIVPRVASGKQLLHGGGGGLDGHLSGALAAGDGVAVHGGAVNAQATALQGEVEEDAGRGVAACRVGGVELRGVAVAGGAAVEGVADSVQDGGLTGAGGPVE